MATHSSILAWRTPQTEEPGGLQSMSHTESDMTEHGHSHVDLGEQWKQVKPSKGSEEKVR